MHKETEMLFRGKVALIFAKSQQMQQTDYQLASQQRHLQPEVRRADNLTTTKLHTDCVKRFPLLA